MENEREIRVSNECSATIDLSGLKQTGRVMTQFDDDEPREILSLNGMSSFEIRLEHPNKGGDDMDFKMQNSITFESECGKRFTIYVEAI